MSWRTSTTITSPRSSSTRTRSWSATPPTRRPTSARWSRRRSARRSPPRSRRLSRQAPRYSPAATAPVTTAATSSRRRSSPGSRAETDLLRQETFGPVAPIVPVKSLDEAIELANGTQFGLGANIYTRDLRNILRCMREIKAGHGLVQRPPHRQRRRPVRRLQAVRPRPRAGPRGPGGVPGDQARPHRDRARDQGLVVPVRGRRQIAGRRRGRVVARAHRRTSHI